MRARIPTVISVVVISMLAPIHQQANAAPMTGVGVVTSNLLMYYDYRNYNSYPGTGATVNDASGNGYAGTLYNSPSYTHTSTDSYLSFNYLSSQYQSVPSFTSDFSAGFTISFRADFGGVNTWERIIDFGTGLQNSNILVSRSGNSNDLWFETYGSSANNTGTPLGNCKVISGITNYAVSTWTISVAANGGSCAIYKDGVAQSVTFTGTDISPVDNVARSTNYIGRSNWSSDSYFEGKIYNVAIYNRALTASEATQNYNSMSDTTAPYINPSFIGSPENSTAVTTLTTGESSYFTLLAGGDAAKFSLATNGLLAFNTAPNYEAPTDSDTNNQYAFNVRVMDSNGNWAEQAAQVTVTNVLESAALTSPTLSATAYKGLPVTITVTPSSDISSTPGKVTYLMAGKRIAGCYKKSYSGTGSSTCTWEPTTMGYRDISVIFTPTDQAVAEVTVKKTFFVNRRTNTR